MAALPREGELDAGALLPDASCLGKESRTPNSSPTPPANSGGREECAARTRADREGAEREGEEGAHGCASSRGRVGLWRPPPHRASPKAARSPWPLAAHRHRPRVAAPSPACPRVARPASPRRPQPFHPHVAAPPASGRPMELGDGEKINPSVLEEEQKPAYGEGI
nr:uncharacterized protein LOC127333462 [Lolium perenne]